MRTLVKTVKINCFITLKNHQWLAAIQPAFIQEKWLNLGKDSELYGILTGLMPITLSPVLQ